MRRSTRSRRRSSSDFPTAAATSPPSTQDELERWVRPTGFFRQKSRAVRACCQALVDRFGGEVPRELRRSAQPARRRSEDGEHPARQRLRTAGDRRRHARRPALPAPRLHDQHRPRQDRGRPRRHRPSRQPDSLLPPAPVPRPAHLPGPEAGLSGLRTLAISARIRTRRLPKPSEQRAKALALGVTGLDAAARARVGHSSSNIRRAAIVLRLLAALTFLLGKPGHPLYLGSGRSSGGLTNTRIVGNGHEPTHAALTTDDEPGRDP